jgi:hypothetical protein
MRKLIHLITVFTLIMSFSAGFAQDKGNWRLYRSKKEIKEQQVPEAPLTPSQLNNNGFQTGQPSIGIVNIYEDYRITKMVDKYMEAYSDGKIDGYRVQLFFGDRDSARETKATFLKKYPTTRADVTYLAPNFRVRVGNFRTLMEAEKFKNELGGLFPNCYIVPEKIPLPPLKVKN